MEKAITVIAARKYVITTPRPVLNKFFICYLFYRLVSAKLVKFNLLSHILRDFCFLGKCAPGIYNSKPFINST